MFWVFFRKLLFRLWEMPQKHPWWRLVCSFTMVQHSRGSTSSLHNEWQPWELGLISYLSHGLAAWSPEKVSSHFVPVFTTSLCLFRWEAFKCSIPCDGWVPHIAWRKPAEAFCWWWNLNDKEGHVHMWAGASALLNSFPSRCDYKSLPYQ